MSKNKRRTSCVCGTDFKSLSLSKFLVKWPKATVTNRGQKEPVISSNDGAGN